MLQKSVVIAHLTLLFVVVCNNFEFLVVINDFSEVIKISKLMNISCLIVDNLIKNVVRKQVLKFRLVS